MIGPKPKNYLVESIFATLCCCLPLGIVAIVFAAQVDSHYTKGNYGGSMKASENAKLFMLLTILLGVVVDVGWLVYSLQHLDEIMKNAR